jgi:hypothetical protein
MPNIAESTVKKIALKYPLNKTIPNTVKIPAEMKSRVYIILIREVRSIKGPTNKLVRIEGIILAIANKAKARGEPVLLKTRIPKAIPAAELPIADINVPTVKIVKFLVQSFIVYLIFTIDIIAFYN